MRENFDFGLAFIFEGDTEKYFYINLLEFICAKHGCLIQPVDTSVGGTYIITNKRKKIIVCTNMVGTITQITHSGNWFNNSCANKYSSKTPWKVFLCYDTDSYEADITKFQLGDWKMLRSNLTKRNNIQIIDVSASAEIEDIFLIDLESISQFLGLETELTEADIPSGGKGKTKLTKLFRENKKFYHAGIRALPLIKSLNKQRLLDSEILPLKEIENAILSIFIDNEK